MVTDLDDLDNKAECKGEGEYEEEDGSEGDRVTDLYDLDDEAE